MKDKGEKDWERVFSQSTVSAQIDNPACVDTINLDIFYGVT